MAIDSELLTERSAKHAAVLDAARRMFIRDGYGATGMDAIAKEAGVAKQTIYNHFRSKEELFAAVVRGRCDEMTVFLEDVGIENKPPEEVLRELGNHFLQSVLSGKRMPLLRVLVAEAQRFPELGRIYYQSGPDVAARRLAHYLEEQNAKGVLQVPDPRLAAEAFYGMLSSHLQVRALLELEPQINAERQQAHVNMAVETLLRAWKK